MIRHNHDWTLQELFAGVMDIPSSWDRPIKGLSMDSRELKPGEVFCALTGCRGHGLDYAQDAVRHGAVAILSDHPSPISLGAPLVVIPDLPERLGEIASRFYGDPSRKMVVIGVTGTDGKTSVAHFIAQALNQECSVGVIGTLGYGLIDQPLAPLQHTTPQVIQIHQILAELAQAGARWVVLEASSHGLDQGRLNGVAFNQAVLTHLGRDHLDYHGDLDRYAAAKRRLFSWPGLDTAVVNLDDAYGRGLIQEVSGPRWFGFSFWKSALDGVEVVRSYQPILHAGGIQLRLETARGKSAIKVPVYGLFNATNALTALTSLLALGLSLPEAIDRLPRLKPVPGRMERFMDAAGRLIVVDYAHTPGALEAALQALRSHGESRLWCVFGAGGERDRGKRPLMAEVAERLADEVILTDDNPRGEDPDAILADLRSGLTHVDKVTVIRDRAQALERVLSLAGAGDVILIAGKGHEEVQVLADGAWPFSDRAVIQNWLRRREA